MSIRNSKMMASTAAAAAIVAALAVPSMAAAAPAGAAATLGASEQIAMPSIRTSGGVGFLRDGIATFVAFDVRSTGPAVAGEDHQPAKGILTLVAADGTRFTAAIDHVHAHAAGEVHFGGVIVRSQNPGLIGKFVHVVAVDGGSPGRGGDSISVVISDTAMHSDAAPAPVTRGDLSIRSHS